MLSEFAEQHNDTGCRERDEVTALRRLCVIKRAQLLKLRIKIRRPGDIKMEVL